MRDFPKSQQLNTATDVIKGFSCANINVNGFSGANINVKGFSDRNVKVKGFSYANVNVAKPVAELQTV